MLRGLHPSATPPKNLLLDIETHLCLGEVTMPKRSMTLMMCVLLGGAVVLGACSGMQMPDPFAVPKVDERPNPHPDHLVQLGDVVSVVPSQLEGHTQEISWSQDRQAMTERYILVSAMFHNPRLEAAIPSQVPIYIHVTLKDAFLRMCEPGAGRDTCRLKVNKNFRYGQDAEKSKRFLVLHDRTFTPWQHRFMDTNSIAIFLKTGKDTADAVVGPMADYIPYGTLIGKAGDGTAEAIKQAFGDQLWIF